LRVTRQSLIIFAHLWCIEIIVGFVVFLGEGFQHILLYGVREGGHNIFVQ